MKIHLNNEGQKCKTGPVRGRVPVGGGGETERINVGEYDLCTLYTCLKIEH
jgi:hypothetical protein